MKTIPEIRSRIDALAYQLYEISKEMGQLSKELMRRSPVRKSAVKSVPMTPELAAKIRETAQRLPELSNQQIAIIHGVNHGRVSEALRGKRK